MPKWNLFHMRSPLNTPSTGNGQYRELTKASGRKFTFASEDQDTLTWSMPGNHPETAAITPLVDDVLAYRDDAPVQRFRVVSRVLSKNSGVLTATFAAVSYRGLLDAWVFHDGDVRSFPALTEQTAIAWTIITQGQKRVAGNLGISRGELPVTTVNRALTGSIPEGGTRPEYFQAGMKRSEAINNIADMTNGFEWDIEPDPSDPYRLLKFNAWNYRLRNQHANDLGGRSPLVLDDGGTMASWTHTVTPSDYANVMRFTGDQTTDANGGAKAIPILPVWTNQETFPSTPPEGRWERDINHSGLTTQSAVAAGAQVAYDQAHIYVPEITCNLKRGKWTGPSQLWIGDQARFMITEAVDGSATDFIIYVDENVRVVEMTIDVDEQGAEDVFLSLNRRQFNSKNNTRRLNDRLTRLERR